MKEEDHQPPSSSHQNSHNNFQMQNPHDNLYGVGGVGGGGGVLPWSFPPVQNFNPTQLDPFLPSYGASLFNTTRRGYDGLDLHHHNHLQNHHHQQQLRLIESIGPGGSGHYGLQTELMNKMSAQEIMDAKALAASKSHSEAERRRRERINNHLARLRSLLPSTTKTDKASLLAEVIQHVKELKRQTSLIEETSPIPSEIDELTVDNATDYDDDNDNDGKCVIKASLCCEDRSDLLPDIIKTLKSLHLRTIKAEITTLGGRVKNVLFVSGDDHQQQYCISTIQEALKAVMEKSNSTSSNNNSDESSSGNVKRQRTTNVVNIL